MNLVLNARDVMPEGGTLAITTGNDDTKPLANGKPAPVPSGPCVRIWVRDSGPGIEPAVRARLFEPHFTTKLYGHGLGLKITSQIVERYGGQIRVHSALGQGTTFEVRLPQHADHPQPQPQSQPQPLSPPRGSETVLVVEDDEGVAPPGARDPGAERLPRARVRHGRAGARAR